MFDFKNFINLKKEIEERQAKVASQTYIGTSGGGMVTAKINGKYELISIIIEDKAWEDIKQEGSKELLQDLIISAVNNAMKKAQEALKDEMSGLLGKFNLPFLQNLF